MESTQRPAGGSAKPSPSDASARPSAPLRAFCPESAKLNIIQCRMARTALDWSLQDLADESGVSRRTVARFEAGESVLPARVQALRHVFEAKGILFIDHGKLAGGVVPPQP